MHLEIIHDPISIELTYNFVIVVTLTKGNYLNVSFVFLTLTVSVSAINRIQKGF